MTNGTTGDPGIELMAVGEVAERTGLSVRTLRHYEELDLILPSGRTPGGFRLYSPADVDRLLLIRRMKPLGFTLEEMGEFLRAVDAQDASPDDATAREALGRIAEEARRRMADLQTKVAYATEFIALLDQRTQRP